MHGTRDMDELGLETPFQDSREAEDFETSSWSGESPFAAEDESQDAAAGEDSEGLDWLDYDSETSHTSRQCSCGAAHEQELDESWSEDEDEAPRCWREDETPAQELENAAGPTPEHLEFRTRVFERVLRDRKGRKPFPDLDRGQLDRVPRPSTLPKGADWSSVLTGKATAAAAGRLLEDAHRALREAQQQGDVDALRTRFIYPNSGYRSSGEQKVLWLRYFSRKRTGYYDLSADARSRLPGGPHSAAAVDYMVKPKGAGGFGVGGRIAPPGYSNHQNAIALDFTQVRSAAKYRIPNSTAPKDDSDRKWKASWFHRWLNTMGADGQTNAARHGFRPIPTEAWHWEFRGQAAAPTVGTPANERAPARKATTIESTPFGGRLLDFKAKAHRGRVAAFVPPAAIGRAEVDVLFFVHGLLHVCKPLPQPLDSPVGLITQKAFQLGKLVTDSGQPIIVVAPFFNWAPSAGSQPLASPATLNALIQEVLDKVGSAGSPVSLRRLVIAGHSRAFGILDPLAARAKSPDMEQGALARLAEVWALDTAYGSYKDVSPYTTWLARKPNLTLRVFYRPGSPTDGRDPKRAGRGHTFLTKRSPGRLEVVQCKETHCAVPVVRLPALLAGLEAKASEAEHDEYLTLSADSESTYGESDFESYDESEAFEAERDESFTSDEDENVDQESLDYEAASDSEWHEHEETSEDSSNEWESWEQQPEYEGSVADLARNAASGIMQDYSLKSLADGKLVNIPTPIRDDVLSGRDQDVWKVANRVLWEKYPQLKGQKLNPHDRKHRAAVAEYGRIVLHIRSLVWLCRLVQLLDKHRGDLPRSFLLGWMAKESDGHVGSTTPLREMGYFQVHPAEGREVLKLSDTDFERIGTDREHSIKQGIRLVQAHRKAITSIAAVPDPSDLLLRLTKARHGLPGLLKNVLTALKKAGKRPDWAEVAARMRAAGDRGVSDNVEDTMRYAAGLKGLVDRIP
jgi:hypothetical protein